jgi:hypothetical protein
MRVLRRFFIRLLVSVLLALLIGLFFFNGNLPIKISGLAVVMLILSYLFEYTKKRDRNENV